MLVVNLGSLSVFKYSVFFAENINLLFSHFGIIVDLKKSIPAFMLILPIGISFYTFQSVGYTIDVYRTGLQPVRNILLYFSFISFFPKLAAGPIVRASEFLPQLTRVRKVSRLENWNGLKLILIGLFKKLVLADNIAPFVNSAFSDAATFQSSLYWWIAIIGFAFQIYFDFSGYSDIARGLAKWVGIHIRFNFNHPYTAKSISDFWKRWHVSLSTWFRDYVYNPLGGSKKGKVFGIINIWIIMLIYGFWHGPTWTFILWGALHALYLSIEGIFNIPKNLSKIYIGKITATVLVALQVIIAWVFFKSETIHQALDILHHMFDFNFKIDFNPDNLSFVNACFYIGIGILIESWFFFNLKKYLLNMNFNYRKLLEPAIFLALILTILFLRGKAEEFMYFKF